MIAQQRLNSLLSHGVSLHAAHTTAVVTLGWLALVQRPQKECEVGVGCSWQTQPPAWAAYHGLDLSKSQQVDVGRSSPGVALNPSNRCYFGILSKIYRQPKETYLKENSIRAATLQGNTAQSRYSILSKKKIIETKNMGRRKKQNNNRSIPICRLFSRSFFLSLIFCKYSRALACSGSPAPDNSATCPVCISCVLTRLDLSVRQWSGPGGMYTQTRGPGNGYFLM